MGTKKAQVNNMTFGEKLKAYREEKDMTLEDLAQLLGTTKQVLSRYERGERTPKITTARAYANAMGVDFAMLTDESYTFSLTITRDEELALTEDERQFILMLRKLTPQGREAARQMLQSLQALQAQLSADRD